MREHPVLTETGHDYKQNRVLAHPARQCFAPSPPVSSLPRNDKRLGR